MHNIRGLRSKKTDPLQLRKQKTTTTVVVIKMNQNESIPLVL